MKSTNWTAPVLVGVIACLATLLVVDMTGGRGAYAQDSASTGYIAVVAGPVVRNRIIPLIIVDTQAMTIMTYDYEISGTYKDLILTTARTFKYDRKLINYSHRNSSRPHMRMKSKKGEINVEDVMEAISKQKPLD